MYETRSGDCDSQSKDEDWTVQFSGIVKYSVILCPNGVDSNIVPVLGLRTPTSGEWMRGRWREGTILFWLFSRKLLHCTTTGQHQSFNYHFIIQCSRMITLPFRKHRVITNRYREGNANLIEREITSWITEGQIASLQFYITFCIFCNYWEQVERTKVIISFTQNMFMPRFMPDEIAG